MDRKLVIIINGTGGVGKDTMCEIAARYYPVDNISSITPVKDIASLCGWNGEKDDKSRKFLSDLKALLTNYNDYPNLYLMKKYEDFMKGDKQLLFVHIRECGEIDKFRRKIKTPCITLLIKRTNMEEVTWGNVSDDMVENYDYDYTFDNNRPLEETDKVFIDFLGDILNEEL